MGGELDGGQGPGWSATLSITLLCAPPRSGTQSLGVSDPGRGTPEFISVGCVDSSPIITYDSVSRVKEPRAPWMPEHLTTIAGRGTLSRCVVGSRRSRWNQGKGGVTTITQVSAADCDPPWSPPGWPRGPWADSACELSRSCPLCGFWQGLDIWLMGFSAAMCPTHLPNCLSSPGALCSLLLVSLSQCHSGL